MVDRLERLTNLVALLLTTPRHLTVDEIAERLESYPAGPAARRQAFERDKRLLRAEGIPLDIQVLEGGGGRSGYRIRPEDYYLPDLDLDDDERVALHLALAAVHLGGGWAREAGWKLGEVDAGSGPPLAGLTVVEALPALFEGWRRRAPVSFGYGGEQRTVEPWGLLFRGGFWYVAGHDRGRQAMRTFRADRIEGRVTVGEPGTFEPPAGFDLAAAMPLTEEHLGRGAVAPGGGDAEVDAVEVAVDHVQAAKVVAELGEAAVVDRAPDGGVTVRLEVANRDAFRSWLLGFLDHAVVVGPDAVRDDVVTWLEGMATTDGKRQ